MKVDLYKQSGEKSGTLDLPKEIFEIPFNEELIHQALVRQLANKRVAIAHTKTRAEVRGGGRKPFRQKGTGNARQGTIRSPLMKGGGIVFGPQPRSYRKNLNKKMKTGALLSTLAFKLSEKKLFVLQDFNDTNKFSKTKDAKILLDSLNVAKHSLLVLDGADNQSIRSTNNIDNITTLSSDLINASAVARSEYMIITKKGITNLIQNRLKLETKKEVISKPQKTTKNKKETK